MSRAYSSGRPFTNPAPNSLTSRAKLAAMGGHSHWSQIKRQKGGNDAKRGNLFTKLSREITVSAREGGGDPAMNPRLRLAIDKARYEDMPADDIIRAMEGGLCGVGRVIVWTLMW